MLHKDADKIAQRIADADKVITEFKYRQALTLTKFETLCSKKEAKRRDEIVWALEYDADEMCEHGYFSHYTQRMKNSLKTTLKLSDRESEELLMTYYFSLPREREKFKRHIIGGVVEKRPELYTLKPNPEFKRTTTLSLVKPIIQQYQGALVGKGILNIPNQLAKHSKEDKEMIKSILYSSIKFSQEQGIERAVKNLTSGLLPYYFKEASPYIKKDNKKALSESLRARPEKYARTERLLNVFGWLFLTHGIYEHERIVKNLYPKDRRKEIKRFFKQLSKSCCDCCYC